jgi:predicted TPR repeat methyltransferase
MSDGKRFLDEVYGIEDAGQTHALYDRWAASYDAELRANGYASPARVAKAMTAHIADLTAPLLDLGCGTGLSGEAFADAGFTCIDGTDFSAEMLAVAEQKNVYRKLILGDLAEPLPASRGDYANIAAVGVFSPGHAPAEMIDNVVEILPAGGCFGFTLNDHALEEKVYEEHVRALQTEGAVEIAHEDYGPHLPRLGLGAKIYVLRAS